MPLEKVAALMKNIDENLSTITNNQCELMELIALTAYQKAKSLLERNMGLIHETLKATDDALRMYNEEYLKNFMQASTEEEKKMLELKLLEQQRLSEKISTKLRNALDIELTLEGGIDWYDKENPERFSGN
jgi:hypothetical protein